MNNGETLEVMVDGFFREMAKEVKQLKKDAYETGISFNMLDYMRCDELGLSSMIGNLLDPNGTHGQGSIFLKEFLRMLPDPGTEGSDKCLNQCLDHWTVYKESAVETGRIDLMVLDDEKKVQVFLENKPFAREGQQQLERYSEMLLRQPFGYLVYMNGTFNPTGSLSNERRQFLGARFVEMSYRENGSTPRSLERWLQTCCRLAQADKIKWYLFDFVLYIQKQFPAKPNLSISNNKNEISAGEERNH